MNYLKRKIDEIINEENEINNPELKEHLLTKRAKKIYFCDQCKYTTAYSGNLPKHKRIHSGEKSHICKYKDCTLKFISGSGLKRHQLTHTHEKIHKCDFDKCDKHFGTASDLKKHKMTHTGEKPFKCNFNGCTFNCIISSNLKTHQRTHTGEKPYLCDICDAKFSVNASLKQHKMIHTGEKPHACLFAFCGYKSRRIQDLKKHQKVRHSERGHQRQKKEEEKIDKFLTSQNILFDRELQVDFKCVFGSDRAQTCAKIDFVIQDAFKQTLFLIEVDEDEHITYDQSCETRRMMDCYTSLLMSHLGIKHMVWIRYNPNRFKIDEEKQKVDTKDRQAKLLEIIQTYQPTKAMEILYLYYSIRWSETKNDYVPVIFDDPDYNCELKPLCQIIE